jgi:hypothetical protein
MMMGRMEGGMTLGKREASKLGWKSGIKSRYEHTATSATEKLFFTRYSLPFRIPAYSLFEALSYCFMRP